MPNFDRKKSTFFTVKIRFFTKKNNSQGIIFIPLGVVFGPRRGDYLASGVGVLIFVHDFWLSRVDFGPMRLDLGLF